MFSIQDIENRIAALVSAEKFGEDFIFELLSCYGVPRASISRLQKGTYNLSKNTDEILWKNKLCFKRVDQEDAYLVIDALRKDQKISKNSPRFIIVTSGKKLLALDTKTSETIDIKLQELTEFYDFFLPWAGMEKASHEKENIADVKAASKMAKLFDEIRKENPAIDHVSTHSLHNFFSRLLFCYFAEDTEIFAKRQFTKTLEAYTQTDGSDSADFISKLFAVLNISPEKRTKLPQYLSDFPYVNGGLFSAKLAIPKISGRARRIMIECGDLNWSQINPDIFGSMIQAVVHQSERAALGMHYTSVPNILKVIEPLFLNDLKTEFANSKDSAVKLKKLLSRIYQIKIFDPACGSGNFLIIAYKELRRLENQILKQIEALTGKLQLSWDVTVMIENFYGLEIDDFACEIAKLSLWLVKHQMNLEYRDLFGSFITLIPLKTAGNIVCNNAARIDWQEVCPNNGSDEIYVIGNPPYQGSKIQDQAQKEDFQLAFPKSPVSKNLDYISIWFIKGADYIANSKAKLALVSTNSICQGEQVAMLWPIIFAKNLEIHFAHSSFKWQNNAKANAGVTCVIIGLRNIDNLPKFLFTDGLSQKVENINGYLLNAENVFIKPRSVSISRMPPMLLGSSGIDGGNLVLTKTEVQKIIAEYPDSKILIKRYVGGNDLLNGLERYCLWITDDNLEFAKSIPLIKNKIENCFNWRCKAGRDAKKYSSSAHKFAYTKYQSKPALIMPMTFSENRSYLTAEFIEKNIVPSNGVLVIYEPSITIFGILTSRMHMVWMRAVCGRLKTDYRYSSSIVYNNFPVPELAKKQTDMISTHVLEVLNARGKHSELTLAQMYDPEKMPADLREAHAGLDLVVERCYRLKPFTSDEERLAYLFKLYEEMIAKEKQP